MLSTGCWKDGERERERKKGEIEREMKGEIKKVRNKKERYRQRD